MYYRKEDIVLLHPDMDLRESIFFLGSVLLKELMSYRRQGVTIDTLLRKFLESSPRRTQKQFLDTITFLYAVGLVELNGYRIRVKDGNSEETLF